MTVVLCNRSNNNYDDNDNNDDNDNKDIYEVVMIRATMTVVIDSIKKIDDYVTPISNVDYTNFTIWRLLNMSFVL